MIQYRMETDIINSILKDMPQLTTRELHKEYNNLALNPIKSYNQFISAIADDPTVYEKVILTKDQRANKIRLALQEAENALIDNASKGDVKSIEFLLKTQDKEYRDKRQLDISISTVYQEQLQQLDVAITSNKMPILEAEIDDE